MFKTIAVTSVVGLLALGTSVSTAGEGCMGEGDIADKRIYLKVPLGGEFPLYYAENGIVDGFGEKLELGRFMAPKDQGNWWVADGRLCQQWQEWYDGKRHCFELTKTGDTSLYWKRDDGLEGEARIGQ
ncbi:MAG TPA: hypothetical protein VMP03_03780 [Methylomirabilota bacterium]|nr:hypothetical protein [Methylomirabilota bacterium]